jgi:hypothetical protein
MIEDLMITSILNFIFRDQKVEPRRGLGMNE